MGPGHSGLFLLGVIKMSGLFKQFKTNKNKESSGVVIEFPEAENENKTIPCFQIARMGKGNKDYDKALEAATRPYRRQMQLGTMKNDVAEELFLEVFCSTVLRGWAYVQDENGQEIQFSKKAAVALMKELPDVYERLQEEAKLAANFKDESLEAEAKN